MNPVLEEMLRTGLVKTADGSVTRLHSAISTQKGAFLQELIRELQPVTSLEIGLAFGVSALFMCEALAPVKGARHIIADPSESGDTWKGGGLASLKAAGFESVVEFHEQPSHLVLAELEAAGRRVDFAFIDGAHLFDNVIVDFFGVDRLLRTGGVVVFDDLWMPAVQSVCRYVVTNRGYRVYRRFPATMPPARQRLTRRALATVARWTPPLRRVLRPEFVDVGPSQQLRLPVEMIALQKERENDRPWDFHREF